MNDNDLRNTSFDDDYRRLIAEAYPGPKTDIRAAVMAQIAKDADQGQAVGGGQTAGKAKILTKRRMNRFVKFGSMAACFVLLATLGFRILPMMMKDAVVEEAANTSMTAASDTFAYSDDTAMPETMPETSAVSGTGGTAGEDGGLFKSSAYTTDGSPIEEGITEDPAKAPSAPVQAENYAAAVTTGDISTEEAVPEEAAEAPAAPAPEAEKEIITEAEAEEAVVEEAPAAESVVEEAAEEEAVEEAVIEEAVVEESMEEAVVEEAPAEEMVSADLSALPQAGEILTSEEAPAAIVSDVEETVVEEAVTRESAEAEEEAFDDAAPQPDKLLMSVMPGSAANGTSSGAATATIPRSLTSTAEGCLHTGIFGNSFHDLPQAVVNLATSAADTESVAVWCSENAGTCGLNIYELLHTFSVPREAFETLYNSSDLWYHHDYNTDLLYSGDSSAVYEYYLNGGSCAEFVKRYFEYQLKLDLYAEAGSSAYNAWAAERGYNAFCKWSIAEFVRDLGISRERFTELHAALTAEFETGYPGYAVVEYDLDLLYGMGAEITDSIARGDMGYVTDALYHK